MTMCEGVNGGAMSDAILGKYLDDLGHRHRITLFRSDYVEVYDKTGTRIMNGLTEGHNYWNKHGRTSYRDILRVLLGVEAVCQARLAPDCWAKFERCKRYLQEHTIQRTPSPHRERRGHDTPEPERRPLGCLLQRLLTLAE